jgi:IS30 family transposase
LLDRSISSVTRELKRNGNADGRYNPATAVNRYKHRRKDCVREPRLCPSDELYEFVCEKLRATWSPEQIVLVWKRDHPDEKLGVSTIYRAVRRGSLPGIAAHTHLRRRGKRRYGSRSKFNTIQPEHTIHDRPEIVENRERIGDWEGDTVAGGKGKGYLVTFIERSKRVLVAAKVATRSADGVAEAAIRILKASGLPVHTITLDNGAEMAGYKKIEEALGATVYFADPHAPWQRGANENVNDLLRFFFPHGMDLRDVPDEIVILAVRLINDRPRKCLGLRSPSSFLPDHLHLT